MTFREKLRREHPELRSTSIMTVGCPHHYGYEMKDGCSVYDGRACSCAECWDREIPGTEKIKKENENMTSTKKTKAELLEELEQANQNIRDLTNEIKNLERYKQYEDMANELKAMHTTFINSGFSDEQAFEMMKYLTTAAVPYAMRGAGV